MRTDLKAMNGGEMEIWAQGRGLAPYRARQIRHWLLGRLASSFDEMTDLPKGLRASLSEAVCVHPIKMVQSLASSDGTRKFLFRLPEGRHIESVLIPERDHFTVCISSQAGCAMGCRFCLTGKQGLRRNLRASEIVDQVIQVKRSLDDPQKLTNVVFMGMGEPLANYDAVRRAIENLVDSAGMNFSHRKVTLSTCGLVPEMERLGREATVNLAVSLNAADDATRNALMPINRRYPLARLLAACRRFPLPHRRMITFEMVLIRDVNDRPEHASRLANLLRGIRAKVNLIPFNPHPGTSWSPPAPETVLRFQEVLLKRHLTAIVRKSKGGDIQAACGQLSGRADGRLAPAHSALSL